jgi:hypothetical protein
MRYPWRAFQSSLSFSEGRTFRFGPPIRSEMEHA